MNIILSHSTPASSGTRPGAVIMVEREGYKHQPYVTAWRGDGDEGWHHGHYYNDRLDAIEDFVTRARRGY